MAVIRTLELNNGQHIPVVGLGTYARSSGRNVVKNAVITAIRIGYRHIDTASFYGNEEEIGEALKIVIKEGVVKREELFIVTKLWCDDHGKGQVLPALQLSLKKLKLDYVDLYLVHWPISVNKTGNDAKIDLMETWTAMENVQKQGLTKAIGLSNFNEAQIDRILKEGSIKPVTNQFEINARLTCVDLVRHCQEKGIVAVAYCPLGSLPDAKRAKGSLTPDDPTLKVISEKYKKTAAQILLKFLLQRGLVVIPKSYTESRIRENVELFDFELTDVEISDILKLNRDERCVKIDFWSKFLNYPF